MNKKVLKLALMASNNAGFTVYQRKDLAREVYLSRKYNKAGDTVVFTPHTRIGDAMELLIAVGGSIEIDNDASQCKVLVYGKCVYGYWKTERSKIKNICNAILNSVALNGLKSEVS